MNTRQKCRKAAQNAVKNPRHGKSEVFTYTSEEGAEVWLAVEPLRHWAEENLPMVGVDLDSKKVEQILRSGRVSKEHVMQHTFSQNIQPILVACNFHKGKAEIVDGNHTYMAMAVAATKAKEMSINIPSKVPAYCIEREDWAKFIVPRG